MSFFTELKRRNVFRVGIAYGVATWLLIQVTDIVFPRIGLPDSAVTLVIALLAIGFILAMIFAWAFEMTPEGIKREKDVDATRSITPHTGKRLDRLIIAGLVLVIVGMGVERAWFTGETGLEPFSEPIVKQSEDGNEQKRALTPIKSVAVLPFTAMSSGEDDGYFADGLTEEILNALTALPELLVTARTSSFHFKGRDLPIPEIAATLGVDHIVEGSVRRSGERVRITAQLIRAEDGFHLWSDTYDRTLEDIFAVQEDIAENIAGTLDVVLSEDKRALMRKAGIRDVQAFIAYQKGLEAFVHAHATLENVAELLEAATPFFDRALKAAPDLVAARVLKADAAGHKVFELVSGERNETYPGEGVDALNALREEYELAWESSAPGNQRDILDVERSIFAADWKGLAAKVERALEPGDCPQTNWTLELANSMGLGAQVVDKVREELRCNPYDPVSNFTLAFTQTWIGDPQAALRTVEEAQARGLRFSWLEDAAIYALLALGEVNDQRVQHPRSEQSWIRFPREILPLAVAGDVEAARKLAEIYWAEPDADDWSSLNVAAVIGDRQHANEFATRIDARPGSALVFFNAIYVCACGAPFELDATPNFKARIEEAGFDWPPPSPIKFPAKDW